MILDIDYRPVLWGLTAPGLGEQRYVESARVSEELQRIVPQCDLIVGTEEEIRIAGGTADTPLALRRLRALTGAVLVMKRGPMGCLVFPDAIADDLGNGITGPGFPVEVFNVLGAGDAFMAGFLRGWLRDEPLERCSAYANACGALVVSRHGCAPAMPSWVELQQFLAHGSTQRAVRRDRELEHLHRASTRLRQWPELAVLAFDHRLQFEELAGDASNRSARSGTVDESEADRMHERIARFKRLLAEGGRRGAAGAAGFGMIVDDRYGDDVLPGLTGGPGWIARPVELPGSRPLRFEAGNDIALALRAWPSEHVAKCLVSYHPDDDATLRSEQLASLQTLQAACIATDRELLIEVIPPRELASDDDTLARALAQIYAAGVRPDWWKLPPPESGAAWQRISACIGREDPFCRGVLLLGLAASEDALAQELRSRRAAPDLQGLRRRSFDLRRSGRELVCRTDRRRSGHRGGRRPLRATDRPLAQRPRRRCGPAASRHRAPSH